MTASVEEEEARTEEKSEEMRAEEEEERVEEIRNVCVRDRCREAKSVVEEEVADIKWVFMLRKLI